MLSDEIKKIAKKIKQSAVIADLTDVIHNYGDATIHVKIDNEQMKKMKNKTYNRDDAFKAYVNFIKSENFGDATEEAIAKSALDLIDLIEQKFLENNQ